MGIIIVSIQPLRASVISGRSWAKCIELDGEYVEKKNIILPNKLHFFMKVCQGFWRR